MRRALLLLAGIAILSGGARADSFNCIPTSSTLYGGLAHAPGAAGSFWTTDIVAVNPSAEPGIVRVEFLGNIAASAGGLVPPGGVLVLPDVVVAAGLPDGAYGAAVSICGGDDRIRVTLTTKTAYAGGFLATQLPALSTSDGAILPLVSAHPARVAVYVVTGSEGRWRVEFVGADGLIESHDGLSTSFARIEVPTGALFARFFRYPWQGGPGGWEPDVRAFAYVTFADAVTGAPEIVE